MLYNLLANGRDPFRQADIGEASLYALIGFAVVFIGIAFLIFIVWATGKIVSAFEGKSSNKAKKRKEKSVVKADAPSSNENATATQVETEEISEETVAIITAAIMAYYQENNPKCEFTLKRIKRI